LKKHGAQLVWNKSTSPVELNIMVSTGDGQHAVRVITAAAAAETDDTKNTVGSHGSPSIQDPKLFSNAVADYDARTPLHIAGCLGDVALFEGLVRAGVDPSAVDSFGNLAKLTDLRMSAAGTVRVFRREFTLDNAIGSHACSLEARFKCELQASRRVTNGIPLWCSSSYRFLPVHTVNCVQNTEGVHTPRTENAATNATLVKPTTLSGSAHVIANDGGSGGAGRVRSMLLSVILCDQAKQNDLDRAEALLDKVADDPLVDICDYDFRTPLHVAASEGNTEMVELLLRRGAAVDARDRWGKTALCGATFAMKADTIRVLLLHGATLGMSRMHEAVALANAVDASDYVLLKLLIKTVKSVGAADYDGRTALHIAAGCRDAAAYAMLVQAGANQHVQDRWGGTPFAICASGEGGAPSSTPPTAPGHTSPPVLSVGGVGGGGAPLPMPAHSSSAPATNAQNDAVKASVV
jgi:ankyrin repeat protein